MPILGGTYFMDDPYAHILTGAECFVTFTDSNIVVKFLRC